VQTWVRYLGLAHFDTLIWPTWVIDIVPHFDPGVVRRIEAVLVLLPLRDRATESGRFRPGLDNVRPVVEPVKIDQVSP
jgi:hypothetical protein